MRDVIRFSLHNKFAVLLLTLIVIVTGLYAGITMKQETIPNLEVPMLTVTTVVPGAAPQDVAERVTIPLEQRIKGLSSVKEFSSTSMENVSSIVVQYNYGQDMDKARTELQEAVAGITLPQGAQPTKVAKISLNDFPVISLSLSGENMPLEDVTRLVETDLRPSLEGIAGVGTITVSGEQIKEAQLRFNRAKLAAAGLTEDTVRSIVQGSAVTAPLGLFEIDNSEKTIVIDGNVHTLEQLRSVAIPLAPAAQGGIPAGPGAGPGPGLPTVRLGDVADVSFVTRAESISRTNGLPSIGIQVTKTTDANTVEVVNAVKKEVDRLQHDVPAARVLVMVDQGKPIEESVRTMMNKALFGALFAIIVILLFLRNLRTTLISVISIPLSLLIALAILKWLNITLNIMTLGAMTVAIGRVVDDSIVVIENNYRRMGLSSETLEGEKLIIAATREMFVPIFSSTLVTIAVFLPLGVVSGPIGQLFMPFALTMVFALLASLVVAVTVVPALAHLLFRRGRSKRRRQREDNSGGLARSYRRTLNWALNHKWLTSALAVALLAGSLALAGIVGFSFLPEEEQKYAMLTYDPAPGKRLADTEATAAEAEKLIRARQGVTNLQYSVGGESPFSPGPSKSALFYVQYVTDIRDFAKEKTALLDALRKLDPQGSWGEMSFGGGGVGGSKLSLNVYGDNEGDIRQAVGLIQNAMRQETALDKIDSSLSRTYEQYTFVVNQPKLSSLGLTAGQIAMQLTPNRTRPSIATITDQGKDYPVYIQAEGQTFKTIADVARSPLPSPVAPGAVLQDVSELRKGTSPNTITRKNGKLYAEVTANVTAKDVGKVSASVQNRVAGLKLPPSVRVDYGGVTAQMNETFRQLGLAIAAAVAIVYLLLVITFGGALTPLAILFSLPFTVIGGLIALYIAGETISASVMMGALMLIGIVVTNAIVLIDRVLHKEREGLSTREALLEAAATRLRPILMTALATIGALLPLALGFENTGGSLISKGLGVTVIGGLISSTLLTLLIVPIVYESLSRLRRGKERAPQP